MPLVQDIIAKMKASKRKKRRLSKEAQAQLDKIEEDAYVEEAKKLAIKVGKDKAKEDFIGEVKE